MKEIDVNYNTKHILIVDENNKLKSVLNSVFDSKYKIVSINSGKEAWYFIQKEIPDLIISDVLMAEMNGLELCELVKSTFDTAHIPVILFTTLSDKKKHLEALRSGADDYISSPFDITLLKERIINVIRNRTIVRERTISITRQLKYQGRIAKYNDNQFIVKAISIVRENIADCKFSKNKFAASMNVSSSLLYKKLKTLTGESPIEFIKVIRLDLSLELLQSRKYTVTEISEMCGFSTIGYFCLVFKKHFGESPTVIQRDLDISL